MKNLTRLCAIAGTSLSLLTVLPAMAEMALDTSRSSVSLVSVKVTGDGSTSASELFRFTSLTGAVDASGKAEVIIPLDQIETGVGIRNERMAEYLFETDTYPEATITAAIPDTALEEGSRDIKLPAMLDLHGKISELSLAVTVNVQGDQVFVNTTEPVLLDTNAHEFSGGLAKLADLAKVFHIPSTVPVSFNLAFTK
ncbi:MAG: YceI family protein [Granulosicoccus sp.]